MPEIPARPPLADQLRLQREYPQRMSALRRGDPNLKPDLIETRVVQESYDQEVMDTLSGLGNYLDGLVLFIEKADPAIGENILQGRDLPFLDAIRSIEVKRIKNYDDFFTTLMGVSEKIDALLAMELSDDSRQKLEALQELLMDSLE